MAKPSLSLEDIINSFPEEIQKILREREQSRLSSQKDAELIQKQLKSASLREELAKSASDPKTYKKSLKSFTPEQALEYARSRQKVVDEMIRKGIEQQGSKIGQEVVQDFYKYGEGATDPSKALKADYLKEPNFTMKPKDVYQLARETKENPPIDVEKIKTERAVKRNPLVPYEAPGLPTVYESPSVASALEAEAPVVQEAATASQYKPNFVMKPTNYYDIIKEAKENPPINAEKIRTARAVERNPIVPYEKTDLPSVIKPAAEAAEEISDDIELPKSQYSEVDAAKAAEAGVKENIAKSAEASKGSGFDKLVEAEDALKAKAANAEYLKKLGAGGEVKPIYANPLEEAMANLNKLPKEAWGRLSGPVGKLLTGVGIGGGALSYADAVKASNELVNQFGELPTKQQIGKGLKTLGGSAGAAGTLAAMSGVGLLPGMATATAGAGLYGLGEYLDRPDQVPTPPPSKAQTSPVSTPEVPGVNVIKNLSDEDIKKEVERAARGESATSFPADIVNIYKETGKEEGINPALLIGHSKRESGLISGITTHEGTSTDTATGLGQLTSPAYKDVQKANKEFQDISFEDLNKPENAKLQAKAHAKYFKQLLDKNAGNEELALRQYYQGGYSNEDFKKFADNNLDEYGRPLVDKLHKNGKILTVDDQKAHMLKRGYDGPLADNYVKDVYNYKKEFEEQEKPVGGDRAEALRRLGAFLKAEKPTSLAQGDKPLVYGPSGDAGAYGQAMKDSSRLDAAKKRYDALMAEKEEAPESKEIAAKESTAEEDITPSAAKFSGKEAMEDPSLMPLLLQALKSKGDTEGYVNILRGLNQAMHGAIGARAKVKIQNLSDKLIEDQAKYAGEGISSLESMMKMQQYLGESDPNSKKAVSYRNFLNKTFNIDPETTKNLSLKEMKELTTPLASMTKAERDYNKKVSDKYNQITYQTRSEINKLDETKALRKANKAVNILSRALTDPSLTTGAGDIGNLFAFMKTQQNDDSVVREAEAKMGLKMGGLSEEMYARFLNFFKGQLYTPKIRQDMLNALKAQRDQAKHSYDEAVAPYRESIKRLNIPQSEVESAFEVGTEEPKTVDENKLKEYTNYYYNSEQFKKRYPDDKQRMQIATMAAKGALSN